MGTERELEARSAAVIAAGMMAVALADGEAHPREVAMIESFTEELPAGVDPSGVMLSDPWEQEIFVRSLVMVAVADGHVSEEESSLIHRLARDHGIDEERVKKIRHAVAMEMAYRLAHEELPEG